MNHSFRKALILISIIMPVASCVPIVDNRGHGPDAEDFKQVIVGQSGPDDVRTLIGSPSAKSTYGEETWYYITEKKETVGAFAPDVTEQHVTAVIFDANHVVSNIAEYKKGEGKEVQFVSETTPTEGHHMSITEQMLGNFGRFKTPERSINPRDLGH